MGLAAVPAVSTSHLHSRHHSLSPTTVRDEAVARPAETPTSGVAKPALCLVLCEAVRVSCQHFLGCWRGTTRSPPRGGQETPICSVHPSGRPSMSPAPPTSCARLGVRAEPFLRSQSCLAWRIPGILNRLDLTLSHPVSEKGTMSLCKVWCLGQSLECRWPLRLEGCGDLWLEAWIAHFA